MVCACGVMMRFGTCVCVKSNDLLHKREFEKYIISKFNNNKNEQKTNNTLHLTTLPHTTKQSTTLHHTTLHYSTPHHTTPHHTTPHHTTPHHTTPTPFMQKVEGEAYFGAIEAGLLLRQTSLSLHQVHQVASVDELYDEKESGRWCGVVVE